MPLSLQIGNPPDQTLIFHITDVENLAGILENGGLHSDAEMAEREVTGIGYDHIKERRLKEIQVPCCGSRFVGEFVPFYYCPRSPMLYVVNNGKTGRVPGCQKNIVHLVSWISEGIATKNEWAISDRNAGAHYASFENNLDTLKNLDWAAIRATQWSGRTSEKSAEFLVADFFPWNGFHRIGCQNLKVADQVRKLLETDNHQPSVDVESSWYY